MRFAILWCLAAPWCRAASDLEVFERNAARARQLGATHIVITEDIPPALWEMDVPGDPYPAWYMYHPGLLKVFPPATLERYVDKDYAEKVAALFQARCEVLRRLGLKAAYTANEPHVLPEAFFTDHPDLRGPRVDHPNRSRTARFAPCVDQPATLALYREALQKLLKRLPEVEVFFLTTTDAGSGLCWTPALYPGLNGPAWCQRRPMEDRVAGFLKTLHDAAAGMGHEISVDLVEIAPRQWMIPTFDHPELIARKLPAGMAVNHLEGPDGHRVAIRRFGGGAGEFAPVVGVPRPIGTMRALMGGGRGPRGDQPGGKLVVSLGDPAGLDLNFKVLEAFQKFKPRNQLELWTTLNELAGQMAGKEKADDLLSLWMATDEAERYLGTLNFGPVLTMGGILGRWVNRPLVPLPELLTKEEKSYYRPFLFQAKGEEQADDLIDIQAMRMYEGWGARLLVENVIEKVTGNLSRAEALAARLREGASAPEQWELLSARLGALQCLVRGVDDVVKYQAQLDRVKAAGVKPEPDPVLGAQSGWDRTDLMRLARNEIDNALRLRQLLLTAKGPLLDLAPTAAEETIRKLGPDLPAQLKRKIDIMSAHWEDYKRLFTTPNP
ncbi:MAG: hypothetical protein ABSH44_09590 [Bryobacteraceae bacterium]